MNNMQQATIGETQNIIQIRANLECLEKQLPKEKALELAKRIRPVMSKNEINRLSIFNDPACTKYWVDGCKIYNQSYSFNANIFHYGKALNLKPIAQITTYHKCGHPLLVKPSVYEVLYQIPSELLNDVVAFELYAPSNHAIDIYSSIIDRHVLTCILYTGTMPDDIKEQPIEW